MFGNISNIYTIVYILIICGKSSHLYHKFWGFDLTWIDNDFPKLLGAELYRPHPAYIIEMAIEPVVVHDLKLES